MELVAVALPYIQITLAVLLVGGILLQQSGSGVGGAFGGDNFSAGFHLEAVSKHLLKFQATIILATLFALSTFAALIIS